ncbi:hypothetical protein EJ02DRAFT_319798, partial [Clathrospora elynae]
HQPPPTPTNLLHHICASHPLVRYTVYAGLALMVTAESTFWFHVLRARFFPRASAQGQQDDGDMLEHVISAVKGYREVYMVNHRRYYASFVWGVG